MFQRTAENSAAAFNQSVFLDRACFCQLTLCDKHATLVCQELDFLKVRTRYRFGFAQFGVRETVFNPLPLAVRISVSVNGQPNASTLGSVNGLAGFSFVACFCCHGETTFAPVSHRSKTLLKAQQNRTFFARTYRARHFFATP